jgi:transcription antitermination factor NusG
MKGYTEFVPLYASQRAWSDRRKTVHLPLFSGYVFLQLDIRDRLPVLKTPGVVSFVSLGPEPTPINEREIAGIRSLVESGVPVGPWPYLREGQTVEVEHGALKGLRGILLKFKSEYRLVVSVHLLQRSVAVEVDREAVRPLL